MVPSVSSQYFHHILSPRASHKGACNNAFLMMTNASKERQMTYDKTKGQPGESALVKKAKWQHHIFLFQLPLLLHPHLVLHLLHL